ncbi:MAG: hypothetical protein WBL25_14195 [Anaerolineales bacterium]
MSHPAHRQTLCMDTGQMAFAKSSTTSPTRSRIVPEGEGDSLVVSEILRYVQDDIA